MPTNLELAKLMYNAYKAREPIPHPWAREDELKNWLTGDKTVCYRNYQTFEQVICFLGVHNFRNFFTSLWRRTVGTYPEKDLDWVYKQIGGRYSGATLVGHSGGVGKAMAFGRLSAHLKVVGFKGGYAAARTKEALLNPWPNVTHIWIKGDHWGDGDKGEPLVRGPILRLDKPEGMGTHLMPSIIKALELRDGTVHKDV